MSGVRGINDRGLAQIAPTGLVADVGPVFTVAVQDGEEEGRAAMVVVDREAALQLLGQLVYALVWASSPPYPPARHR